MPTHFTPYSGLSSVSPQQYGFKPPRQRLAKKESIQRMGMTQNLPLGRWLIRLWLIRLMMVFLLAAPWLRGQEPDGVAIYKQQCALCHDNSAKTRAPAPAALKLMSP